MSYQSTSLRTTSMPAAQSLWMRMYTGNPPWSSEDGLTSMNLPAVVASEVARMATVEMQSHVTPPITYTENPTATAPSSRAAYLEAQYQPIVNLARIFTEYAAAGGSLILKPYPDGGRLLVDIVKAGAFEPTAYDSAGTITGCRFAEQAVVDDITYTRIEEHRLEAEGCRITNTAYTLAKPTRYLSMAKRSQFDARNNATPWGNPVPLDTVPQWADLSPDTFLPGQTRLLLAHLRMPFANTVDPQSPLGVSAFARATGLIREADRQFSRLLWEMESGERALYVDSRAFPPSHDPEEIISASFRRFYRTLDIDPASERNLFADWSPNLRDVSHLNALNEILQRVEDACALSRGTLSQAPESASRGARTATELKIMRQRTYALVRDTQKAVELALRDLLTAMDTWATLAGLCPPGEWDVTFAFDDSVVTDRSEEFAERQRLVELGAMKPWEMRMWYLGETAELAQAAMKE